MATRFVFKTLATAALGIALNLSLPAPVAASSAASNTAGALQLDPPVAPSNCKSTFYRDRRKGDYTVVGWSDNSNNEDGFTFEAWRNQSGGWVLAWSRNLVANSNYVYFDGRVPSGYKFRVKAFNASGDSAWSNWGH